MQALRVRKTQLSVLGEGEMRRLRDQKTKRLKDEETAEALRTECKRAGPKANR
jgi:hypothetical protein